MEFLDKLTKVIKTVDEILDSTPKNSGAADPSPVQDKSRDTAVQEKNSASSIMSKAAKTPARILESGTTAAKPSRQVNETFYDGEDAEVEVEYSFKLSGDFLPLESGAADDVDYIAEYLPYSNEEYGDKEYSSDIPYFCITCAAEYKISNMIAECKNGGTPEDALMFLRVSDLGEKFYFKAKIQLGENIIYFYALDKGINWDNNYIGVWYNPDVLGTPLEKKLMAAVDEAAATYKETVL